MFLCVLCPLYLRFVSEVQDALHGDNEERFEASDFHFSPKREVVPVDSFSGFSGACKLEPYTPELGPARLTNEGLLKLFVSNSSRERTISKEQLGPIVTKTKKKLNFDINTYIQRIGF